jgi:hypothetical protein
LPTLDGGNDRESREPIEGSGHVEADRWVSGKASIKVKIAAQTETYVSSDCNLAINGSPNNEVIVGG